jgi:hypothetical protein
MVLQKQVGPTTSTTPPANKSSQFFKCFEFWFCLNLKHLLAKECFYNHFADNNILKWFLIEIFLNQMLVCSNKWRSASVLYLIVSSLATFSLKTSIAKIVQVWRGRSMGLKVFRKALLELIPHTIHSNFYSSLQRRSLFRERNQVMEGLLQFGFTLKSKCIKIAHSRRAIK